MLISVFRLSYHENIEDFLPLDSKERSEMDIYQHISGANEFIVLFDNPDIGAIDRFTQVLQSLDSCHWADGMVSRIDESQIQQIIDQVYTDIPYFLTDSDYSRMDSLLGVPGYVESQIKGDLDILQLPTGGFAEQSMARDPLGLFLPVLKRLQSLQRESHFKQVDGCIFTPDTKHAIVLIPSPFGNSETEQNSKFSSLITAAIDSTVNAYPTVSAHVTGGPAIAVSNASRIKQDSILTVSLASVLIILLLVYSFRSWRNIALTGLSILWGCLFALAGMSFIHSQVSLIVIGISSMIIGIAFNYPLHLVNHLSHVGTLGTDGTDSTDITDRVRETLREITRPLLVGNITTIGAFLALVPLKSVALRDLGIFASLLLLGTILFVLIFLPHMLKGGVQNNSHRGHLLDRISHLQPERSRPLIILVCILTVIFGIASIRTQFDPVLSHINYMTDEQRADMNYFQSIATPEASSGVTTVYLSSSDGRAEGALLDLERKTSVVDSLTSRGIIKSHTGITGYIPSEALQRHRLQRWNSFVSEHSYTFFQQVPSAAQRLDFTPEAFAEFGNILRRHYTIQPFSHFRLLTQTVFKQNCYSDRSTGREHIVDMLYVPDDKVSQVEKLIPGTFDIKGVNAKLLSNITDNFNYIGWACSLIVFFFLWYSFCSLKLAFISFIPMALSWLWILGIMSLCGLKFNIVNIILATFIFGQGDDYTIFMTEGCLYEQKYHRPMLASYKNSIILSALIMFAGIGVLVLAGHPALKSLGTITIVGMFSVVLMAYTIPPLLFKICKFKNQ